MRFERGLLAASLVMCACGPRVDDDDGPRVCGEAGPARLLALDADEAIGAITRIDDRFYVSVGTALQDDTELGFPQLGIDDPRVVAMGTCGESPKVVARDVPYVYRDDEHFPGALLGRNENEDGVVLDPSGVDPPVVFEPTLGNYAMHTELGAIGVVTASADAPFGMLTLQPYPAQLGDPPPPRVPLLDGVQNTFGFGVHDGEVIALTNLGELQVVDLATASSTAIAHDVADFMDAMDGSGVVLVHNSPTGFGPATLVDRATGAETVLVEDASTQLSSAYDREIVLDRDPASGASQRVITLPDRASWDLPPGVTFVYRSDDGTVLAHRGFNELVRYDVVTGEITPLFDGFAMASTFDDDAAELFVVDEPGSIYDITGELWRVPYSGGAPERIAERVGGIHRRLSDGRIVSLVDVDDHYNGELVIVDPENDDEQVIDHDVYVAALIAGPPFIGPEIVDDGLVMYVVRDGDRSGIWLAKP
ncbi:MAG TPA: hypothetical protein VG755_00905 [Nannocystaceae bacterium]|nr:hypothetical protein [Nannocystaceae bacterium]